MSFKLLYNFAPCKNLISNTNAFDPVNHIEDLSFVWNDYDNYSNSQRITDIHNMFNVLGIDYTWSKQEDDSLAFINMGSIPHNSERYDNTVKYASETFKKPIIYSSQEPWQLNFIEKQLNKYDNIIMMDNAVPVDGKQYMDRYKPFPFMILRMLSLPSNIMMIYPDLNYMRIKQKFNCLLWNWRVEKHICYSYIRSKNLDKKNIITFNKPDSNLIAQSNVTDRLNDFFIGWGSDKNPSVKEMQTYAGELLQNADNLKLRKDVKIIPDHPTINSNFRGLPKYVYEETAFSLVCESFCGSTYDYAENQQTFYKDSQAFITEKTLFPLMNGHPWITFGEHDFHKGMETYGFSVHDELFDLSFDNNPNSLERIDNITDIVEDIDLEFIKEQVGNRNSETHKKIRHNKYQMFNKNSFLWKKLKLQFIKYMDEILEL